MKLSNLSSWVAFILLNRLSEDKVVYVTVQMESQITFEILPTILVHVDHLTTILFLILNSAKSYRLQLVAETLFSNDFLKLESQTNIWLFSFSWVKFTTRSIFRVKAVTDLGRSCGVNPKICSYRQSDVLSLILSTDKWV